MLEPLARARGAVKSATARTAKRVRSAIDLRDIVTLAGVSMMAYGGNIIYPGAGWLIAGAALFWIALRGT